MLRMDRKSQKYCYLLDCKCQKIYWNNFLYFCTVRFELCSFHQVRWNISHRMLNKSNFSDVLLSPKFQAVSPSSSEMKQVEKLLLLFHWCTSTDALLDSETFPVQWKTFIEIHKLVAVHIINFEPKNCNVIIYPLSSFLILFLFYYQFS